MGGDRATGVSGGNTAHVTPTRNTSAIVVADVNGTKALLQAVA